MTKIGLSLSLVAFVGVMIASTLPAQAQNAETRLSAKMISGVASGKADYRSRGNRKRLNVEAEDLPGTTPAALGIFVNASAQVGTMALAACPATPTLLCGELELNTHDGQAVPTLKAGDIISIGTVANSAVLSGALR